jgi:hypothetical protein
MVRLSRFFYEMNMVRHQAVSQNPDAGLAQILADKLEVEFAVADGEEDLLTIRSPLGDMIRNSRSDHSRVSGHLPEQVQSGRQNSQLGRA